MKNCASIFDYFTCVLSYVSDFQQVALWRQYEKNYVRWFAQTVIDITRKKLPALRVISKLYQKISIFLLLQVKKIIQYENCGFVLNYKIIVR